MAPGPPATLCIPTAARFDSPCAGDHEGSNPPNFAAYFLSRAPGRVWRRNEKVSGEMGEVLLVALGARAPDIAPP